MKMSDTTKRFWTALREHSFISHFSFSAPIFLASLVPSLFISSPSHAIDLTLAHGYNGGIVYNLSWDSVEPSTDTATVTYYIFQEFGLDGITGPFTPGNAIHVTEETSFGAGGVGPGSRCFVVISSDSLGGPSFTSDVECHNFIHNLTGEGIARVDGSGTQLGVNQEWNFTYSLDADSYVTARVYPPGTQFTLDSNNFIISAGSAPIKTLLLDTPRSQEMETHNVTNETTWDSRNSSGAIVGNGIYYFYIGATLDSGYFQGTPPNESNAVATPETLLRAGRFFTIPVDVLRILNFTATPINLTNTESTISYDLTGAATVRLIIVKPGSGFTVDSNGEVQPLDLNTGLIDSSLIISTISFQRASGTNNETWDGTYSTGSAVANGVYPIAISATDAYGNHAIDNSGDDYPIFTSITVERTQGSQNGGGTSDTTDPTLTSLTPSDGSTSNSPVTSIVAVVADSESALNLAGAAMTVRDPNNALVSGTLSNNGIDTLTFTPTSSLQQTGTYSVQLSIADVPGNSVVFNKSFTVDIRLDSAALEGSLALFPNPAKNTSATIRYTLGVASTVEVNIFNILGERVYSTTFNDSQGTISHTWDLKNSSGKKVGSGLYIVRIKAKGSSGGEAEAIKKLVVVQ